jgi:hypothetical protein
MKNLTDWTNHLNKLYDTLMNSIFKSMVHNVRPDWPSKDTTCKRKGKADRAEFSYSVSLLVPATSKDKL